MSTSLHDIASHAQVAQLRPAGSLPPGSSPAAAVDMIDGDGPCFVLQVVGSAADLTQLVGVVEESADGTSWSALSGNLTATAENTVQTAVLARTKRYLRWNPVSLNPEADVVAGVYVIQPRKTV
jgi:hypothetical protein